MLLRSMTNLLSYKKSQWLSLPAWLGQVILSSSLRHVQISLTLGMIRDTWLKGRRWPMLVLGGVISGTVCILLGATPIFLKHKGFGWFV